MTAQVNTALLPGIGRILEHYLNRDPATLNSDWFGTLPVYGLLKWASRGVPQAVPYAQSWLRARIEHDSRLDDEAFLGSYDGHHSRVVRLRHLPITTYAGFFGVAIACHELHRATGDPLAADVVTDTADTILHRVRRHGNGLVAHDDAWDKAIPDTCFFATEALMRGAAVSPQQRAVYIDQAVYQLQRYIEVFLDPERHVPHTMLHLPSRIGTTYWSRATGWLMWAWCAVLRGLPSDHPARATLCRDLARFAEGIEAHLGPEGALHVHVDNHQTPPETTGTAMAAMGLHEAARSQWIDGGFALAARRMWDFVCDQVHEDGSCENVYKPWALPAEQGVTEVSRVSPDGFSPSVGIVLLAAAEFLNDRGAGAMT